MEKELVPPHFLENRMTTLVTGAAGFIGAYTCQALAARGERVVGLDNYNDYYDPQLKRDRLARLTRDAGFRFVQADVPATYADVSALAAWTGFRPATSIDDGVGRFVAWYRGYYNV